jgi:hypothetical protein
MAARRKNEGWKRRNERAEIEAREDACRGSVYFKH